MRCLQGWKKDAGREKDKPPIRNKRRYTERDDGLDLAKKGKYFLALLIMAFVSMFNAVSGGELPSSLKKTIKKAADNGKKKK